MLSPNQKTAQSALCLANAGEIISGVIMNISGNDISSSLNGNRITTDMIQTLAYRRIVKKVTEANKA